MRNKRVIVYPYNMTSRSARVLARSFHRGLRVYPDRSYRPRPSHLIVNWGSSTPAAWDSYRVDWINQPAYVKLATNKLSTFEILRREDVSIPEFTTNVHEAYDWDYPVIARSLLRAHSGRGAYYIDYDNRESLLGSLNNCPLYVKYIKKSQEYRVHVFNGEVIDAAQKRVREGSTENDFQIRSYRNGWVFCRDNKGVRARLWCCRRYLQLPLREGVCVGS